MIGWASILRAVAPWALGAVALWFAYDAVYDRGYAAAQLECEAAAGEAEKQVRAEENRQTAASAAATQAKDDRLNEKLPAIEGRTNEAKERVRVIYRDRPVPADCRRPDGVRDEIERARQRANTAGGELRGAGARADSAVP